MSRFSLENLKLDKLVIKALTTVTYLDLLTWQYKYLPRHVYDRFKLNYNSDLWQETESKVA